MQLNDYQKKAIVTDVFADSNDKELFSRAFLEKVLGIMGESGELADKVKKILRDQEGILTQDNKTELTKELGDVLWYISAIASYLQVPLDKVATDNLEKLSSRSERGVIGGAGDNR